MPGGDWPPPPDAGSLAVSVTSAASNYTPWEDPEGELALLRYLAARHMLRTHVAADGTADGDDVAVADDLLKRATAAHAAVAQPDSSPAGSAERTAGQEADWRRTAAAAQQIAAVCLKQAAVMAERLPGAR